MSRVEKWLKMLSEGNKWFHPGAKYHEKMVERTWKVTNMFGPEKLFQNPMCREFLRECEALFGLFSWILTE